MPLPDLALLNAPLTALTVIPGAQGSLADALPVTGLRLMASPGAQIAARWSSPRDRLLEITSTVDAPADWFALRLTLHLPDLSAMAGLGLWLRGAADPALTLRAVLRSAAGDGHVDAPLDRQILCHATPGDHSALWLRDRTTDLPVTADWRELLLFLPAHRPVTLSLHALRLFAVPA
ncbi:MAG: hypothetical protein KKB02_09165 [Alphaproteobacteria bacterium]|nr:hypothetical protein [Alphaproteobacteria bacterium]